MVRLLVPTRNRPTAVGHLLGFLDRFYPGTEVIIADGSSDFHKDAVRRVASADRLTLVDYRPYPHEMPFFDRILDVLTHEPDPYFIMGADDDYPMMDVFEKEQAFLDSNSDYVTALGATVNLRYDGTPEMIARLSISRPIQGPDPATRAENYSIWPFSTTYSLTRREMLIERYHRSKQLFLTGFYDYGVGVQDCVHGKIRALDTISFFGTRNTNHSYLRAESRLSFVRRSDDLQRYFEFMRADFVKFGGLDEGVALQRAEKIVLRFVAERCNRKATQMDDFYKSAVSKASVTRQQNRMFRDLFTPQTDTRRVYEDRLQYAAEALRRNFMSSDNNGESHTYETLDEQAPSGDVL